MTRLGVVLVLLPVAAWAQTSTPHASAAVPAPPAERMTWVGCRAIAPATLQLIWRGVRTASGYTVELSRVARAAPAVRIGTFTTGDTTYTQGSLPSGAVQVSVSYFVRMRDWPRAGDSAVVYPGHREGADAGVLSGTVSFPVPNGQTHRCR